MADNVNVTEGSGKTVAGDDIGGVIHQRVKLTIGADGVNDGDVSAANPLPISGTFDTINRVNNVVDGTLSTVTSLGTATRVDRVMNLVDGTLSTVTGVDRVRNIVDGTLSTVTNVGTANRVNNVVDGTLSSVYRVHNLIAGTVTVTGITASVAVHVLSTNGTMGVDVGKLQQADFVTRVRNIVDGTLTTVTGIDRVRNVVDGTLTTVSTVAMTQRVNNVVDGTIGIARFGSGAVVTPNSGIPAVNVYSTTSIFTVSGSTSGGTTSGVTLIAPSANYNFKVFAYSLQTTAIAANVWRFANGSGASQTEFWRPLVISSETTSTPKGANFGVQPPGFIFATGTSTTLVLHSDAGSLVHYSVSYIKESA